MTWLQVDAHTGNIWQCFNLPSASKHFVLVYFSGSRRMNWLLRKEYKEMINSKGSILGLFLKWEWVIQVQSAAVKDQLICCVEAVHPWLIITSLMTLICPVSFLWNLFLPLCEWLLSAYNWVFILGTSAICGKIIPWKGVLLY